MTTTEYIHDGYAWQPGARLKADATLVGREIDKIGGDKAKRDDLIAAGVGGTGELAKCFTQDTDEAAHKQHEAEADYVMRSLIPIIVNTRTEQEQPVNQRVWIPVYTETGNPEDSGVYRRATIELRPRAPMKPDHQMAGWVALMAWRDRYGDEPLFTPILRAIDALKD